MMHLHESFGLLMGALIVPRIGVKLLTKAPPALPGIKTWEKVAASASHTALYGAMVFMPVSGLAFGYLSGWGVPFFGWNVPGKAKEAITERDQKIEGFMYNNHHRVGQVLAYGLFPAHLGAVAFHHLNGINLLARMGFSAMPVRATKAVVEGAKKAT